MIGTAHVSASDAELVTRRIEDLHPEAIVVELDPQRLPRLGLTLEDLGPRAVVPPVSQTAPSGKFDPWDPRGWAAAAVAPVIRSMVTRMYDVFTARGMNAGGEFAAAISAGQKSGSRIVLGDVESVATIEAFLGDVARTNPFDFVRRYTTVVSEEVEGLLGDREMTPELVEQLKADVLQKGSLIERLRDEVPEFYRTFISARDERLAEAVRVEAEEKGARSLVAVVGLAHVEGIERELGWVREDALVDPSEVTKSRG